MKSTRLSRERPISVFPLSYLATSLLFIVLTFSSSAQEQKASLERFMFVGLNSTAQESFFRSSINAAKMESYRLRSKRVTLRFENGFEIEMLSAKELYLLDNSIIVSSYEESFPANYELPVFTILDSGQLMAAYPKTGKH